MKFLTLLALSSTALAAGGNRHNDDQLPSSTPASSVLATITDLPSTVSGKTYTSLASALYSVEKKFYNDKQYTTVASHMWSAAAKASDSEKVVPSLALSTWDWAQVTDAPWFDKNMPKDDKKYVGDYITKYSEQYNKFVKGDGKDGKKGDDKENSSAQNGVVVWSAAVLAGMVGIVAVL